MAKKSKKPVADDSAAEASQAPKPKKDAALASFLAPSALVICRNKHWRYISSFHGPWLQLPIEVLETLANANYYMPLPRPVDPAVFYDLVKIRQLVDGATDMAVRAANGVASSALSNSLLGSAPHQMQALGLGFGNTAGGAKLSPERRHRMREQATQKLSRAYHLDEIASSVATMQSTSTLENVAGLVLQRAPNDPDANYVHFFHEKIPSRQLAECTDLRVLDMIIAQRPSDCEPLRTRAIVRMFKDDYEGAAQDLTTALSVCRLNRLHKPYEGEAMQLERRSGRRRDNPPLDEKDQPSSTEVQLLFQRAGCYLTLACDHVEPALVRHSSTPAGEPTDKANGQGHANGNGTAEEGEGLSQGKPPQAGEPLPTKKQVESRKTVRLYAKRALRDYMEYLKQFHYSPNLPIEVSDDFSRQVNMATHRSKRYYGQSRSGAQDPNSPTGDAVGHTVYPLATLFTATPPADLPPYPSMDIVRATSATSPASAVETTSEVVTYHPLLTDALHSLLLCHTLVQTSTKELQRHAYMVARLARLADGYPVFQASRSPARADWIEVLRRAENWIELSTSWEALCAPAPLPVPPSAHNGSASSPNVSTLSITGPPTPTETDGQRQERLRHQAIIEALEDERVNDEASFKAAILARQKRAEAEVVSSPNAAAAATQAAPKRWAVDDGREYPILTERAEAVARWIRDAPAVSGTGGGKRKKKPAVKKVASADKDKMEPNNGGQPGLVPV
ncbi:hypothetical protein F4808DRAFT_421327 [Astrocystis sublimbata]|nr:hypothetical protein F4808DRAFT_421327 [Astrocystis sublimbata]